MVLALTSQKGGVGKSSLAFNLATLFARDGILTCIADSDDNQTCLRWYENRQDQTRKLPTVDVISMPDEVLHSQMKRLKNLYDIIIIDGMPTLGKTMTKILYAADYALIPIQLTGPDPGTLNSFADRIAAVNDDRDIPLSTGVVLNRFDGRIQLVHRMREALKDHPLNVYSQFITNRGIYGESYLRGLGISEILDDRGRHKNPDAVRELDLFYYALLTRLKQLHSGEFLAQLNIPLLA